MINCGYKDKTPGWDYALFILKILLVLLESEKGMESHTYKMEGMAIFSHIQEAKKVKPTLVDIVILDLVLQVQ